MTRLLCCLVFLFVCFGCGDDSGVGRDAAVARDGGGGDSGASRSDSGARTDAGTDAGPATRDAGPSDAGALDAATDLTAECATSCDHLVACDARYDRAECVRGCTLSATAASETTECRDRFLAVNTCVRSLECSELPEPMGSDIDLTSTRCGDAITSFVDECVRE